MIGYGMVLLNMYGYGVVEDVVGIILVFYILQKCVQVVVVVIELWLEWVGEYVDVGVVDVVVFVLVVGVWCVVVWCGYIGCVVDVVVKIVDLLQMVGIVGSGVLICLVLQFYD